MQEAPARRRQRVETGGCPPESWATKSLQSMVCRTRIAARRDPASTSLQNNTKNTTRLRQFPEIAKAYRKRYAVNEYIEVELVLEKLT